MLQEKLAISLGAVENLVHIIDGFPLPVCGFKRAKGQLAGQFSIEKCWARDLWHLSNRLARKLLSHTLGIFANFQQQGKHQGDWLQQVQVIGC